MMIIRPSRRARRLATGAAVLALSAGAISACGTETTVHTVVKTVTTQAADPVPAARTARTKPRATPTRRTPAPASRTTHAAGYRACDSEILAKLVTTTCGFAENTFYEYWVSGQRSAIDVYSPATSVTYPTTCTAGEGQIVCTTEDDGEVRFSQAAVDRYSQTQADAYANAHDVEPPAHDAGTASPVPNEEPATSDDGPDPSNEIPNYDNGTGYPVQCSDGMWSRSGGRPGACSGHGGVG
jgi:hypothetical protein